MKAELELAEADGTSAPVERLLEDLEDAFAQLTVAEDAASPPAQVLVVDDDLRLAEVTARGLRRLGFDAHASGSLRSVRSGEVLVVDLGILSALDEVGAERVRRARPVIVTGAGDAASRALGARFCPRDYLVKPVALEQLAAAINRA